MVYELNSFFAPICHHTDILIHFIKSTINWQTYLSDDIIIQLNYLQGKTYPGNILFYLLTAGFRL